MTDITHYKQAVADRMYDTFIEFDEPNGVYRIFVNVTTN